MSENLNPEHQLEALKELRRKYEEALQDAEKSGDYREAEKLKEELEARLSALEAQFPKPEPKTDPVKNSFEKVEKGETTLEKAKEIMGEDYFGTEAIKKAFDMNVGIDRRVPYSEAELRQAKVQGEMLVYRVGIGLTMETIIDRVKLSEDEGSLLRDADFNHDEDFFKNQNPRSGWALVSKDLIKYSTSHDYINQTAVLRDHLIKLNSLSEHELKEVTNDKLAEIRKLMQTDWREASLVLSELSINQNHRRTAVEALYDFVIRFKNTPNKERMLELNYDWINNRMHDGNLVYFGKNNSGGALVDGIKPRTSSDNLGVISVR